MTRRRIISAAVAVLLGLAASCGDDSSSSSDQTATTSATPEVATTTEVRFRSGEFELVGDLDLPAGQGPHPALIIVAGDGPQTRSSTPGAAMLRERFGAAGFAVLSWDKPGTGASTGELDGEYTISQRAMILADAVGFLAAHDAIDPERIGWWGLSQAGWVMPKALELADDVAFMIVVSGGGEDAIEQLAYQLGQQLVCERGATIEDAELVERYFPQYAKSPTYIGYVEAMDALLQIEGSDQFVGDAIASEDQWQPWPPEIDAYFDPMTVIERTTVPVLAVFGEMDRYVDPIQGVEAYEDALVRAGNERSHVEVIAETGHIMQRQSTMCGSGAGTSDRYLELLDEWIETLGA